MARDMTVLIMAAGHGTRMRSELAKVLHPVCGREMVLWGSWGLLLGIVNERLNGRVEIAEQVEGEGTGAAVLAARDAVAASEDVVVLSGDHPLVSRETIAAMIETHRERGAAATVLTTSAIDPSGYGRVVRKPDGSIERIVETKHPEGVDPEILGLKEINVGAYVFAAGELLDALAEVPEVHGERYLTEVVPILIARELPVIPHCTEDALSAKGVNTRVDLMEIEALAREMLVQAMGTDFPVEKFGRGERMHISTTEIERTLADASPEPIEADQKLWRDWLAFLEGAASNGGLLVR